ncbi:FtsX-like permease family protein [Jeotgalibacillus sp. R-1-5s-1]|uniref:FtsX-like permease family protein n=1 Tax=Jeotgalibacillus sp. R-1-5s-1 TaxID=2555897 RepID=UPI001069E5EF|nr:FtsX-like permease family protein [Jeotgalibacillus sp. R-1-5s-1]TFD94402.1 ABC transporter permease [Jeotgalibacillus sp. R-1-5s-1]
MKLSELVRRNMLANIRQYYLYFFSLIFSVMLYFIFSTMQYSEVITQAVSFAQGIGASFRTGVFFLAAIMLVFVTYAKSLFFKRRGREIGLYQLIGLSRGAVIRMLLIENMIMMTLAALVGTLLGLLFSRLFLLLFFEIMRFDMSVGFQFSTAALLQTGVLLLLLLVVTSWQTIKFVRKHTLVQLFQSKAETEQIREIKPVRQLMMGLAGILLVAFGYWLSGRMLNAMLLINMLVVLFSTVLGTYLVFRVSIGWLLTLYRKQMDGHLQFKHALSLAPLIHRLKSNARMLTLIATLSAITLTLVTGAYSLYYSAEEEADILYPHDFIFDDMANELGAPADFEQKMKEENLSYDHHVIETFSHDVTYQNFDQGLGIPIESNHPTIVSASDLSEAGVEVSVKPGEAVYFGGMVVPSMPEDTTVKLEGKSFELVEIKNKAALNYGVQFNVFALNDEDYRAVKPDYNSNYFTFNLEDQAERERANELYHDISPDPEEGVLYSTNVDETLKRMEMSGVLIFIAGFLGIVFLSATGSILYFKQMTEVEEEKGSYRTLRQLGFTVGNMMSGVGRKQLLFFAIPLMIGLGHTYFALKSIAFLFRTNITVPVIISISIFTLIYLAFYILSITNSRSEITRAIRA